MDKVDIYAIMVIYNKKLGKSRTYECLKGQGIKIVVCDNSTGDYDNEAAAKLDGVGYVSMEGNKGLACAYNEGLDFIHREYTVTDRDYVCLFDDDTYVPDEYFDLVRQSSEDILLPVVTDGRSIMSPVLMKKDIVKRIESKAKIFETDSRLLSGINSGMAVCAGVFEKYRYRREMFLDYIDHIFIRHMRECEKYPKVLDVELVQRFSAIDDDKKAAVARFVIQKKDLKIFYKDNKAGYYYVVIRKHIKLALKYKDLRLLFC